jgi:hypothetical protein
MPEPQSGLARATDRMNNHTTFLRVRHPSIDPAEVTTTLGLTPVHAWAAGSAREAAVGERTRGAHPDTYWLAPLGEHGAQREREPVAGKFAWPLLQALPLDAFLVGQARLLMTHKAFFARLKDTGGSCELMVAISASERWGVELPPALLRALAELSIGLSIEVSAEAESAN